MNSIHRTIRNNWFIFPSCDHLLAVSINSYNKVTCIVLKTKYSSNSSNDEGEKRKKSGGRREVDYYEVLGVDRRAQAKEIKEAYIKLSKVYHPDRNKAPEALARFQEVSTAYETIGNYDGRRNYDRKQFGAQIQTQIRKSASRSEPSPFQSSGWRGREERSDYTQESSGWRGREERSDYTQESSGWRGREERSDYTQGLYKDKIGKEKVFRSSPSAEETVTKKGESVTYFDPRESRARQLDYTQTSRHLEGKANFLRRRLVKGLSDPSTDPVSDAALESLLAPFFLLFLSFSILYAVTEIVNYRKLEEGTLGDRLIEKKKKLEDGTLGDRLIEKKKKLEEGTLGDRLIEKKKLNPNYLANESIKEPKFINTKEYNEYVRMKKD